MEKERKDKEKQKKKEKIEKLKQEGKYLTAKQREAQRRAQQMLEAMRAQGRHQLKCVPFGKEKNESICFLFFPAILIPSKQLLH